MFSPYKYIILCVIPVLYYPLSCTSEPVLPPILVLYSPGDPEYTDVLVKREFDNLTLVCELRGDPAARNYVWNYVNNGTMGQKSYSIEPVGPTTSSKLMKENLQISDSGQYMCSAPPFSVTKYILVQAKGPMQCARGAFWCGARCVLAAYVCDGRADCARREDEASAMCDRNVCARSDKLNCSSGRCISASACCRGSMPLCRQPACCDEFPLTRLPGFADEYPPLYEDRHAPDDYGFIQSTIYTVTACALIFMIAVVLLVSAICKMHMKRAALRGYTNADRATRHHYSVQYAQAHRFPPCYEASRLLEENRTASPQLSPIHVPTPREVQCVPESPGESPRGLARLSSIFSSRYRQVPTQPEPEPEPVELQRVRAASRLSSRPLVEYRSPACCGLDSELLFASPDAAALARELNCMPASAPARAVRRPTLERVMDQLDRQRLTLQLGRFQLSIPRFGRPDPRPDTPNVAEINIDDLDFVRLNSNDTYTLNGRTIRLLGANFENYPVLPDGSVRPPSYTEAVRYKLYGPPPEYLSREGLNRRSADTVDQEATSNIEMPPCYEDLNAINQFNGPVNDSNGNVNEYNGMVNDNSDVLNGNNVEILVEDRHNAATNAIVEPVSVHNHNNGFDSTQNDESHVETLSSIIDNLPAIDSDVNANETDFVNPVNCTVYITNQPVNSSVGGNVTIVNNNNVVCNE